MRALITVACIVITALLMLNVVSSAQRMTMNVQAKTNY